MQIKTGTPTTFEWTESKISFFGLMGVFIMFVNR